MGNTESNVTSGVKKQTDASSITLYKLVDLKGIIYTIDYMDSPLTRLNYLSMTIGITQIYVYTRD